MATVAMVSRTRERRSDFMATSGSAVCHVGSDFAHRWGMKRTISLMAMVLVVTCSREQAHDAKAKVEQKAKRVHDAFEADAPYGTDGPDAAKQREQERFDERWRQLQSFQAQQAAQVAPQQPAAAAQQQGAAQQSPRRQIRS